MVWYSFFFISLHKWLRRYSFADWWISIGWESFWSWSIRRTFKRRSNSGKPSGLIYHIISLSYCLWKSYLLGSTFFKIWKPQNKNIPSLFLCLNIEWRAVPYMVYLTNWLLFLDNTYMGKTDYSWQSKETFLQSCSGEKQFQSTHYPFFQFENHFTPF